LPRSRTLALLRRDTVVDGLRRIDWAGLRVEWVVLFGSLARRNVGHDIDLLVKPKDGGGVEWRMSIAIEAAEAVGVDWGLVDVVEASVETPCPVIVDAWRHGLVIYEHTPGAARNWLRVRLMVCLDYEVSARKLGVLREASKSIIRRWSLGDSS
jgi:predicted nucleotidyltransferase